MDTPPTRIKIIKKDGSTKSVIELPPCLEDLFEIASSRLEMRACRIYTCDGGEIDDIDLIKPEETIIVTDGSPPEMHQNGTLLVSASTPVSNGSCNDNHDQPCTNMKSQEYKSNDWVTLNVGGKLFLTTRSTLTKEPNSILAKMVSEEGSCYKAVDACGTYLIDRSPVSFEPILNYLRHGQIIIDNGAIAAGVIEEARYFGVTGIEEGILELNSSPFYRTHKDQPHWFEKRQRSFHGNRGRGRGRWVRRRRSERRPME